jgi:predicted fused transcriptional regulator/phosphomethylpyrimidine kinase
MVHSPQVANIKVDSCIEKALKDLSIEYRKINSTGNITERDIIDQVASEIIRSRGKVRAVIHKGGPGYEPITYIFASSPYELAYYLVNIARKCREAEDKLPSNKRA